MSLPLCRRRNIPVHGEVAQERFNFTLAHVTRMFFSAMEPDIANNPVAVGFFGTVGIMMMAHNLPELVHQLRIGIRQEFSRLR